MEEKHYQSFSVSAILVVTVLLLSALKIYDAQKIDPREPPVVTARIPFIGHLIGMIVYGSRYFKTLGSRHRLPIFTLPILNSRTYIVTEPALAASVQRASKALSFNPVVPEVTQRVLGFDHETIRLMKSDMEHGFVQEIQELVHSTLSPGESLDDLTLDAGNEFLKCLTDFTNEIKSNPTKSNTEDLLKWTKSIVTIATANFLYGPANPLNENPALADQFWDFDYGIPKLLVGIFPSITAKKAFTGRENLVRAFDQFLDSDNFKTSAKITQDRDRIALQHGVTKTNIARSDLSFLFAGIVNTSLASFWLILNVFTLSNLLPEVRREIENTIVQSPEDPKVRKFSIKRVVASCPLLTSAFRETLRLYSDNSSTRVVMDDTMLADTYFLRKGSILQVSGGIIHADRNVWGNDVDIFDPRRFMSAQSKNPNTKTSEKKQTHPAAFRAFGGGSTLCPGRHFALNEIVGFVAMTVLMFDITAANGAEISIPQKDDHVVPIHVLEPVKKVPVKINIREGWKDVKLELET